MTDRANNYARAFDGTIGARPVSMAPHHVNLFDMEAKYADIVGETDVIDYLQR